MITEETIVKASDDLSTAELDGEAVILDINSGQYYGLNQVGAKILESVQKPVVVRSVIDDVLIHFDVDRDRLRDDVIRFLSDMNDKRLVLVED